MTKIIDGRKAEITNTGRLFKTYNKFAVAHGYPEAAANSDWSDSRKKPLKGDLVTLLTSGPHLTGYPGATLWIVEAVNGERHIINETGLRILDADSAPITVLPDESLGGTIREYREVKRKANIGELVKTTGKSGHEPYEIGEILAVTERRSNYVCFDEYHVGARDLTEYVVLEPSDILRIGAKRFRMVDRKAAVGERVIIVDDRCGSGGSDGNFFRVGNVGVYCGDDFVDFSGCGNNYVHHDGNWSVNPDARRVLEPLTPAEPTQEPAPLSALPIADQYAENITVLTRKIAQLEVDLRVAREDIVLIEEGVSDDIKALEKSTIALEGRILALETDSSPSYVKVASGPVDNALPTFSKAPKSAQQIRDEIVERAKADVVKLVAGRRVTHVEYVVNREKKTVVALIVANASRKVITRGIAKCAPGETFNAHIGRAIALYRALGLEVPAEYLTCPQPETVRVGDVVLWTNSYDAEDTQVFTIASVLSEGYRFVGGEWDGFETVRVIDDSREDVGNSAASSALKGAA